MHPAADPESNPKSFPFFPLSIPGRRDNPSRGVMLHPKPNHNPLKLPGAMPWGPPACPREPGAFGEGARRDGGGAERLPGAGRCSRGGAAHGAAAGAFKRRWLRPSRAGLSRAEPSRAPPCACRACRSPSCWRPSPSAPRGRRAARCGWQCWAPEASARAVSALSGAAPLRDVPSCPFPVPLYPLLSLRPS